MPPKKAKQLGTFLRRNREAKGLSLGAIASEARVERSTLLRLERGDFAVPDPDKLHRIAAALEVDAEELFARYPSPEALPDFAPYLRAKYGMSDQAIAEAEEFFSGLDKNRKGGSDAKHPR